MSVELGTQSLGLVTGVLSPAAHPFISSSPSCLSGLGLNPGLCRLPLLSVTSPLGSNPSLASAREETGQGEAAGAGTEASGTGARTGEERELEGAGEPCGRDVPAHPRP